MPSICNNEHANNIFRKAESITTIFLIAASHTIENSVQRAVGRGHEPQCFAGCSAQGGLVTGLRAPNMGLKRRITKKSDIPASVFQAWRPVTGVGAPLGGMDHSEKNLGN